MTQVEVPSKVDDLRSSLIANGIDESAVAKLNKVELKALYLKEMGGKSPEPFSIRFEESATTSRVETKQDALPQYGSQEWQSYVLSQIKPSEQIDGFPRCFGLRRVAQDLLGPIVSSKPTTLSVIPQMTANDVPTRAVTVLYEITFDWTLDRSIWVDPSNPIINYRTFGAVSDCVEDINTAWGRNPAASADTKAESRALKKALCINILSAEERVSGYDEKLEEGPKNNKITDQLVGFILAKANQLKLDISKVMTSAGIESTNVKDLTLEEGRNLFAHINTYQQNK